MPTQKCPPKYVSKRYKNIIHIHDPLLEQSYWVFIGIKKALLFKKEAEKLMPKGTVLDVDEFQSGKFTVFDFGPKGTLGIIWGKDKEHLIHELLHATIWIMGKRGIPINQENDEIMAYYQSFLLREVERSPR